jgi:DNA-binding HxlR family transcriptional regulator
MVELGWLSEATDFIKPRWKNVVVMLVEKSGPVRFAELNRAVSAFSGQNFSDTTLTRTLNELKGEDYIRRDLDSDGRPHWTLTRQGATRAATLHRLAHAYEQRVAERGKSAKRFGR